MVNKAHEDVLKDHNKVHQQDIKKHITKTFEAKIHEFGQTDIDRTLAMQKFSALIENITDDDSLINDTSMLKSDSSLTGTMISGNSIVEKNNSRNSSFNKRRNSNLGNSVLLANKRSKINEENKKYNEVLKIN